MRGNAGSIFFSVNRTVVATGRPLQNSMGQQKCVMILNLTSRIFTVDSRLRGNDGGGCRDA